MATLKIVLPVLFLSLLSVPLIAETSCADVQCDCNALPMDDWKRVCKARELALIRRCESGDTQEAFFCTAHGPAAQPLPLALKFSDVKVLPTDKLPAMYKRVAALYWSMRKDIEAIEQDVKSQSVGSAQGKLEVLQFNIDTLFEIQQQITVSWVAYEAESEAAKAWKDFASDTLDVALDLNQIGHELWNFSNGLDAKLREPTEDIALDLVADAIKVNEQAAHAFAEAGQHDNAARTWMKAADTVKFLIEIYSARQANSPQIRELELQRAAQLYRASYHWVKDEHEGEAQDSLKKARELFDGKDNIVSG